MITNKLGLKWKRRMESMVKNWNKYEDEEYSQWWKKQNEMEEMKFLEDFPEAILTQFCLHYISNIFNSLC